MATPKDRPDGRRWLRLGLAALLGAVAGATLLARPAQGRGDRPR